jgi:hypothetical protein
MSDDRDVLSALIDREPVDPDVLARVLEDPASRRLLVDFVRVRIAAQTDDPALPEAESASGARPPVVGSAFDVGATFRGSSSRHAAWLRTAAVFLLLAAGAGGGAWMEDYISRHWPPEPDRVVQFDPVDARN